MTDEPIDLHGRRTFAERIGVELRLGAANDPSPIPADPRADPDGLADRLLAGPAETWGEVLERCRSLLERYSSTLAAEDERTRELIKRAIADMERLRSREGRG